MAKKRNLHCCIIYILRNKITHHIYIGQTWQTLKKRMKSGRGYMGCNYLFNAIVKYGKNQFFYEKIDFAFTQAQADCLEINYIKQCNSTNPDIGYNLATGGNTPGRYPRNKNTVSPLKGRKGNPSPYKGKKRSQEDCAAISAGMMGKISPKKGTKRSEEDIRKIRDGNGITLEKELGISNDYLTMNIGIKELMIKYDVKSHQAIKRVLCRNGIEPQKDGHMFSFVKEKSIIDDYVLGLPIKIVANKNNTDNSAVLRVLKRNNIKIKEENIDTKLDEFVIKDYMNNVSVVLIFSKYDINQTILTNIRKRNNIPNRAKRNK